MFRKDTKKKLPEKCFEYEPRHLIVPVSGEKSEKLRRKEVVARVWLDYFSNDFPDFQGYRNTILAWGFDGLDPAPIRKRVGELDARLEELRAIEKKRGLKTRPE